MVKNPPVNAGESRDVRSIPGLGRFPGGGSGNPVQPSLPGECHRQRSLAGYSPCGHKESDTTEQLSTSLFLAALSLCWCTWAFLSCGNPGLLFIVVGELRIAGASPEVACGL